VEHKVLRDTEDIRAELVHRTREKALLQLPAYLWERHAPHCTGNCAEPVPVAVDVGGTFVIDCYSFFLAFRLYTETRAAEALLQRKLRAGAA
jgi:hypothetical protein